MDERTLLLEKWTVREWSFVSRTAQLSNALSTMQFLNVLDYFHHCYVLLTATCLTKPRGRHGDRNLCRPRWARRCIWQYKTWQRTYASDRRVCASQRIIILEMECFEHSTDFRLFWRKVAFIYRLFILKFGGVLSDLCTSSQLYAVFFPEDDVNFMQTI